MSYLLDRKQKRKRIFAAALAALMLATLFYFRTPTFNFLSLLGHTIFRPVLALKGGLGSVFSGLGAAFSFKSSLLDENEELKLKLKEMEATLLGHNSILEENLQMKDILGRKAEPASQRGNFILSAILAKPNRSPYDTMIIDVGESSGVKVGDKVFALGNIPIGQVALVYPRSSKVILFSTSGVKTEVSINGRNVILEIVGRGGGNFEMILPRDFVLEPGSVVTLPGIFPYVVAKVETAISDPRDSFTKALLVSPVNVQELRFVEISR